jgi:hypothetical protein
MKLADSCEIYAAATGKASEIVRQLGLGAIALIWIFKQDVGGVPHVPAALRPVAILVVMGLGLDLLQYMYSAAAWGIFNRLKECDAAVGEETEFRAPAAINWFTIFCFYSKTLCIVAAYVVVLKFLMNRVNFG